MANLCNNVIVVDQSDFDKIIPFFSLPLSEIDLSSEDFMYVSDLDFEKILPIPTGYTASGVWGVNSLPFSSGISRNGDFIYISFQTKWLAPIPIVEHLAKSLMIDLKLYAIEFGCEYGVNCECYFDDVFNPSTATKDDVDEFFYVDTEYGITDEISEIVFGMSLEALKADIED